MVEPLHTAAEIAACLGKSPQAVRKQLRGLAADGLKAGNGFRAPAWTVAALPPGVRDALAKEAQRQNYSDVAAMLNVPARKWEPAVPLKDCTDEELQGAVKLQRALKPFLLGEGGAHSEKCGDIEAQGVEQYRRVFGHVISTRYWRQLFKRTVERDRGAENWDRIEMYLSERPRRKTPAAKKVDEALHEFSTIESLICACGLPPTEKEKEAIWTVTFEEYDRLAGEGEPSKRAARRLREFLFSKAHYLAPSREALKKSFNRRLARHLKSGRDPKAQRDGRTNNTGNHDGYQLPESDRDLLVHRSVWKHDGRVAPAWQELLRGGKFTAETLQRYYGKSQNPSHVPHSILDSVGPEIEIMCVMHRGPRAFDSIKGHITRSYDGIHSLRCMMADDFTMPVYWYVSDGNGWFNLVRGQCLLFNDFRSHRILGYSLEPNRNYSSLTIRSLCTHIFGEFGVPEMLYFERGIWKVSGLLKGKTAPLSFVEVTQGLKEFGIQFQHAIRPRSKTIERIGETMQRLMEGEPGYCGRDERHDGPERLLKQKAEVEARKVHPKKYFYDYDQWNKRLGQLIAQYNATEQHSSRILEGLSPDAAFEKFLNRSDPPMQFSAQIRFLLAHHKEARPITLNGVTIQVGKKKFNYKGAELSHLVGRMAVVWFDPENPETAVVTTMDRDNPICVARSKEVNALENLVQPEEANLISELRRIDGQALHMKARFSVLKTKFKLPQRRALVDAMTSELGKEIEGQKRKLNAEQRANSERLARTAEVARDIGVPLVGQRSKESLDALSDLFSEEPTNL